MRLNAWPFLIEKGDRKSIRREPDALFLSVAFSCKLSLISGDALLESLAVDLANTAAIDRKTDEGTEYEAYGDDCYAIEGPVITGCIAESLEDGKKSFAEVVTGEYESREEEEANDHENVAVNGFVGLGDQVEDESNEESAVENKYANVDLGALHILNVIGDPIESAGHGAVLHESNDNFVLAFNAVSGFFGYGFFFGKDCEGGSGVGNGCIAFGHFLIFLIEKAGNDVIVIGENSLDILHQDVVFIVLIKQVHVAKYEAVTYGAQCDCQNGDD